jgi:hypothetical protein
MEESIMSEICEKPVLKIRYGNVSAAIWLSGYQTTDRKPLRWASGRLSKRFHLKYFEYLLLREV